MVFGTGPRAGHALVSHPDIRLVSFTGSTATAAIIRSAAAPLCKKLSLEVSVFAFLVYIQGIKKKYSKLLLS